MRLVRHRLCVVHEGERVRVVGQPLVDHHDRLAPHLEDPAAVGQLGRPGDDTAGAERRPHIAAADFGPPLDQHDAEARVALQAVAHERPVPGLEDVERHRAVREQHR